MIGSILVSSGDARAAGNLQISCQELREELREELQRFAAETLSPRLTELGKRMRQGVQEDLRSLLMNTPHSIFAAHPVAGPVDPMWASAYPTTDSKAGALSNQHGALSTAAAEELTQAVSQMLSESQQSAATSTPPGGHHKPARNTVTSTFSGFSGECEDNDPDQLGWLSRCRRGFRLTRSLANEKKKTRMSSNLKKKHSVNGRSCERRDSTDTPPESALLVKDLQAFTPSQNGYSGEQGVVKTDWSLLSPTYPASPPPERSVFDMHPTSAALAAAPLFPKVEASGLPSLQEHSHEADPIEDDEALGMLRHPKTYRANKEIGPLLRGKHHEHGSKEGSDEVQPGAAAQDFAVVMDHQMSTVSHRKSTNQIMDDASKAKRVSHGGLRALLKSEECMGETTAAPPKVEPQGESSQGIVSFQLRHSASFSDSSCYDSNVSRNTGSSMSSGANAAVAGGKEKVKSCCRRVLDCIHCCPLLELLTTPAAEVVESYQFDYMSALFIALNAICIGVETDYMARNLVEELPMTFVAVDWCFCIFFMVELGLRLYVYRLNFYRMAGYRWNIFDTILVLMQVFEEVMEIAAISLSEGTRESDTATNMTSNLSVMRILRVLRLVRIIRLVRVMHLVSELRTIVVAIFGTLQSLMWTMALLLLVMYIMSVYLTQMVTAVILEDPDAEHLPELEIYYANVSLCILSLFQAITNGVDWKNMLDPLRTHVNPALALVFCFYVGFSLFALMNIVTGVFVESALQTAKNDKDMFLLHHMTHLFMKTDVDDSGEISWDEFENQLDTPDMQEYFKAVDLDTEEARDLFRLIDVDSSGQIDAEEFVHGCLRLRGPAKAIDLATFMHDYRRTTRRWYQHSRSVERCLSEISSCLPELTRASSTTLKMVTTNIENGQHLAAPPRKKGLSL